MLLRYLDTLPAHRDLWPLLRSDFQPLVGKVLNAQARQDQTLACFERLRLYSGQQAFLLAFHISEPRASGGYYLLKEYAQDWPKQVFSLLVTGGSVAQAQELQQAWGLPEEQFGVYPQPLPENGQWSDLQARAWHSFLLALATEQQANWPLLKASYYGPSAVRHLFAALQNGSCLDWQRHLLKWHIKSHAPSYWPAIAPYLEARPADDSQLDLKDFSKTPECIAALSSD